MFLNQKVPIQCQFRFMFSGHLGFAMARSFLNQVWFFGQIHYLAVLKQCCETDRNVGNTGCFETDQSTKIN